MTLGVTGGFEAPVVEPCCSAGAVAGSRSVCVQIVKSVTSQAHAVTDMVISKSTGGETEVAQTGGTTMTSFENTVLAVINGDSRACDYFNSGIESQRSANWNRRNAKSEDDMREAERFNSLYRDDMRYVARRVAKITGFQYGLVCDALVVIATEEVERRGPLQLERSEDYIERRMMI